ncbi:MAG TPA: biopolymer transporter ExbD [Pontiella sp.]
MKASNPHKTSRQIRKFRPTRKPAGVFVSSIAFCDASLLTLAFFLAVSPFVLQPGVNIQLPASPFTGGARFGSLVMSIARGGNYYFNDERVAEERLAEVLEQSAAERPGYPLIIEADESVEHRLVIQAWNAALEAGISEVSIATRILAIEEVRK